MSAFAQHAKGFAGIRPTGGQNPVAPNSILSMAEVVRMSVAEAAARLGVSTGAVRQHVASGRLAAVKRGQDWWLDSRAVERMAGARSGGGRPLSPPMAWAVLLLASDDPAAAREAAGRERYWSRARAWLGEHPLHEHAVRLRARAVVEELDAHPSELTRVLARPDVLATGLSAADAVGLVGSGSTVEVYAPTGRRDAIVAEHALVPGGGPVRIRWVADELWPLLGRGGERRAPRAAVLLDLLESEEPRARREATRALAS